MAGIISSDESVTEQLGREFSDCLKTFPSTIALYGPLGAGKTTWVKGLIVGLGGKSDDVHSPTFIYLHIYETKKTPVYHFDLYRLKNSEEFLEKGFDEYLSNGLTVIEWPERISSLLPKGTISLTLDHIDQQSRRIKWEI
ncbi:MAG TPA: tRNA (adenosine(37)-N6)-threonylcarbamoyltransferase complex ATPase subunit type 1 TsaE [Chlamydiales bacterium]|nr:tRNA (adenosine(37)-N6)-threonylcarbamoyltransferase complex ATPase subunit type 1 TsaE [Chlamydiales bacterium]